MSTLTKHADGLAGLLLGTLGDSQVAMSGGELYRRPASHAGSYGGWRWECSLEHAQRYPSVYADTLKLARTPTDNKGE